MTPHVSECLSFEGLNPHLLDMLLYCHCTVYSNLYYTIDDRKSQKAFYIPLKIYLISHPVLHTLLSLSLPVCLSVSVPDDRLSADDGDDELPSGSRGIHQRCSHDLPGHSPHLPLPPGEEVKLCSHTYTHTHTHTYTSTFTHKQTQGIRSLSF